MSYYTVRPGHNRLAKFRGRFREPLRLERNLATRKMHTLSRD
jgi:hypothetical protein